MVASPMGRTLRSGENRDGRGARGFVQETHLASGKAVMGDGCWCPGRKPWSGRTQLDSALSGFNLASKV